MMFRIQIERLILVVNNQFEMIMSLKEERKGLLLRPRIKPQSPDLASGTLASMPSKTSYISCNPKNPDSGGN